METKAFESDRSVLILFSPKILPAIDLFRGLADLGEAYQSPILEEREASLTNVVGAQQARAALSDALLFSFAIRRQRSNSLTINAIGSRRGTGEEFSLLTLIGAAGVDAQPLLRRAASMLCVELTETLLQLSADLAKDLKPFFVEDDFIDADRFEAIIGNDCRARSVDSHDSSMKFHF
ncbi:hypothetical protein AB4072_02270 [Microvirga sp. 2MCAF38]|uniref:hypothetical protein n=1 Tax=Microvirga sp. 2MCAF38 TaxID=3232989 RepID=UPI003F987AE0